MPAHRDPFSNQEGSLGQGNNQDGMLVCFKGILEFRKGFSCVWSQTAFLNSVRNASRDMLYVVCAVGSVCRLGSWDDWLWYKGVCEPRLEGGTQGDATHTRAGTGRQTLLAKSWQNL